MEEAGAAAEKTDGKIASLMAGTKLLALGTVAAAAAVGAESIKLATQFQASMTQISTLAGAPQAELKTLGDGVLKLASQVGEAPDSLAQALYHVESSFQSIGITSKGALDILKVAAEGARIGGADLVDVTNALDAAIASGIPGVENYGQAMGALLKIVGSGDMTMQDFADAASTGILATAKVYGASLTDVGAALATFGDNNIRGQVAATDLRMAIMDMTKQATPGVAALESIGIKAGQLGKDLQTGGLNKAMIDLHDHLVSSGHAGADMGQLLEEAFTKKSSAPMAILLSQFDRLESKYPDIEEGAHGFEAAWAQTQSTFKQVMANITAGVEALGVRLGEWLIPIVLKVVAAVQVVIDWFEKHKKVTNDLATIIKDVLIGALVLAAGFLTEMAVSAAIAAAPFVITAAAIGFLTTYLVRLYEHNAKFRAFVNDLAADAKRLGEEILDKLRTAFEAVKKVLESIDWTRVFNDAKAVVIDVGNVFRAVFNAISGFLSNHRTEVNKIIGDAISIWRSLSGVVQDLVPIFKGVFTIIGAVVYVAVKIIEDLWGRFGQTLLTHIVDAFEAVMKIVRGAFEIIHGIFDIFAGIFTGNWSKVWKGIKEILGGVWDEISGVFALALNVIETWLAAVGAVISAIWDPIWDGVTSVVSTAWDAVVGFLEGIGSSIGHAFSSAASWLVNTGKSIITGLWNGLKDIFLLPARIYDWVVGQGGLSAIGLKMTVSLLNGLRAGWKAVTGFLAALPDEVVGWLKDAGSWLLDAGQNIITGLWDGIKLVWNNNVAFWTQLPGKILGFLASSATWLAQTGRNIISGLWDGIKSMFNWLGAELVSLPGTITGFLADAGNWLLNTGLHLIQGLWQGISNAAGWLKDKLKHWAGDIISSITSFFGIGSPSKVMADQVGKWLPAGVAAGIDAHAYLVTNSMQNLAAKASKFGKIGFSVNGTGAMSVSGLANTGGTVGGIGAGAAGGGNTYVTNWRVDGSIIDTQGLLTAVQTAAGRHAGRNPNNGLTF